MKKLEKNSLVCMMFVLILLLMGIGTCIQGKEEFSWREKRMLAEAPKLNAENILDGDFDSESENWAADHLPGRDFLVGLYAKAERLWNLQVTKDIYVADDERLVERPEAYNENVIQKNMTVFLEFAGKTELPVDLMLVPSAGCMMQKSIQGLADPYEDERVVETSYALCEGKLNTLNLIPLFSDSPENLYYRTDHHWTSRGAYCAFKAYMDMLGRSSPPESDYQIRKMDGFLGTTWSRACFWNVSAESLELWEKKDSYQVTFSDRKEADFLFFPEHLEEYDKYPVFLDGNHPLITIRNLSGSADGKLLVIRDSFASCFSCFLAGEFETVTLVDLRYYRQPVSKLLQEEDYDRVLILYSVNHFLTDSNILWLE